MTGLMKTIREAILSGSFGSFRDDFLAHYRPTDDGVRLVQRERWLKAQSRKETNQE
jgi:hypothetical protein